MESAAAQRVVVRRARRVCLLAGVVFLSRDLGDGQSGGFGFDGADVADRLVVGTNLVSVKGS